MKDGSYRRRYYVHYRDDGTFSLMDGFDSDVGAGTFIKTVQLETGEQFEPVEKDVYVLLQTILHHNAKVTAVHINRRELEKERD